MTYIGRFAPSPSGPLHFGSLIAAFGSWLDARANQGQWLVRVEDLDPPREMAGAIELILDCLKAHGLEWDGELLHQSQRLADYDQALAQLHHQQLTYDCVCTRKHIIAMGGLHKRCKSRNPIPAGQQSACRLKVNNNSFTFDDYFHGQQQLTKQQANEDFILKRKDGLHAYMLAVVVDDIQQNISHVIRGADLMHTTCQQIRLFECLDNKPPAFGHLPLAIHPDGSKLSKQTHAPAVDNSTAVENLLDVLSFLNQPTPDTSAGLNLQELQDWAVEHWQPERFKGTMERQVSVD